MRSEQTRFTGGPLDGRVLSVALGLTGRPPKYYRVPVPAHGGVPATVLVYRLGDRPRGGWVYAFDPQGPATARPRRPFRTRREES